jgi:hypothetical protein
MMKRFFFLAFLAISIGAVKGYTQPADSSKLAYIKTINTRAGKIVAELEINDSSKFNRVKKIIADQYFNLNDIYTFRDEQKKNANTQLNADKEGLKKELARIDQQSELKVKALHPTFLSKLSTELTPDQIDKVKDGMTYNVVHVTFNGYNQMILNLTEARKKQIMDWLIEAREHAMDAESSDKKHAWFGKYKGRINNYLSAAGYDLKREGEEWEKRRKAEKGN